MVQVRIAAAIEVNQATIARFEDGSAWPRRPEEVLMAYASELDMDVRLIWVRALVIWFEHEPVLDQESQERIRAALERLRIDLGRRLALAEPRIAKELRRNAARSKALLGPVDVGLHGLINSIHLEHDRMTWGRVSSAPESSLGKKSLAPTNVAGRARLPNSAADSHPLRRRSRRARAGRTR